jgi:hypothetical protein
MRRRNNVSEDREYKQGREANQDSDVEAHVKHGREADASTTSEDVEAHVKHGRELKDDGGDADANIKSAG